MGLNDPPADDGTAVRRLSELGFPLDAPDWMTRLRRARQAPALGRVGPYELLEEIGRGGQGVVYRGHVDGRPVAIKRLLHGSLASETSRLRFEREVEAVRALTHPGIVSVVDVVTEGGQSFLVLDWVDGVPITEWAWSGPDGIRRPVPEIVALVRRVCDALLHAHQRGVIHRDLKPSNLLVDASGEPRILDFGLAKLEAGSMPAGSESVVTSLASGAFLGTIAYAAPEQLSESSSRVDARSDLYALAVVLFELLTHEKPYPLGRSLAQSVHSITLKSPARPSRLAPDVDRRLEAVILRALAKAPEERYPSVDALDRELARVQAGDPVEALEWSAWDGARRVIRRHPVVVATVTALSVLVIAFAVVMAVLYHRAERSALRAERVESFLEATLSPVRGVGGEPVDALERASERADVELRDEPEVEERVRERLAVRFADEQRFDRALTEANRALELRGPDPVVDDVRHARLLHVRGLSRLVEGEVQGIGDLRAALAGYDRVLGPSSTSAAEVWSGIAFAHAYRFEPPDTAAAGSAYRRAIEIFEANGPEPSAKWANTLFQYARFKMEEDCNLALPLLAEARALYAGLPTVPPGRYRAAQVHGQILERLGHHDEAEAALRESIELRRGAFDTELPPAYANLGNTYFNRERYREAMHFFEQAIIARCHWLSLNHPEARRDLEAVASRIRDEGLSASSSEVFLDVLDDVAPWVQALFHYTGDKIAQCYAHMGDPDRAEGIRAVIRASERTAS